MISLKIVERADGTAVPFAGEYVKENHVDAYDGRGYLETTPDVRKAKKFQTATQALNYWKKQSTVQPMRPDGKPNRPLTAFTVEIANHDPA